MRDTLEARSLLAAAARSIDLRPELIDEIFAGAPTDFRVIFSPTLPFRVDRLGMIGITLGGSVYLLERARNYPPAELIALLRHEAEHVRQQREDRLFYPRYAADWLRGFLTAGADRKAGTFRGIRGRWHGAYRRIGAEMEAYAAEDRAREVMNRK